MEDKIVQQAVKTVLEQVYEEDFLGFSYGFRPGRSCHNALDALWVGIAHRKVNWVLDADIRGFFGRVEVWRGGLGFGLLPCQGFPVRGAISACHAPFPHPAHRTGRAVFRHPALGPYLTHTLT